MPSARLEILKALGDNTRYAIYLELARASHPLSTSEIAVTLDLHVNTVRPHLERMREVGLLDVTTEARRGVGRPQHLYALAEDAPSLGLEPPAFPLLSRLLLRLIDEAGIGADDAIEVGREHGTLLAGLQADPAGDCVTPLMAELADLGFDPERVDDDHTVTIAFGHCPFGDLAQRNDVVCSLHCGMVEGFVDGCGGAEVVAFNALAQRPPCQVQLAVTG